MYYLHIRHIEDADEDIFKALDLTTIVDYILSNEINLTNDFVITTTQYYPENDYTELRIDKQ